MVIPNCLSGNIFHLCFYMVGHTYADIHIPKCVLTTDNTLELVNSSITKLKPFLVTCFIVFLSTGLLPALCPLLTFKCPKYQIWQWLVFLQPTGWWLSLTWRVYLPCAAWHTHRHMCLAWTWYHMTSSGVVFVCASVCELDHCHDGFNDVKMWQKCRPSAVFQGL